MNIEKEEQYIIDAMNNGSLSETEGKKELRELYRDYESHARESAQNAYDREYENW
jgi:hypothetical protein